MSTEAPRTVYVFNGPNLNLLGTRDPETYGTTTLSDVKDLCEAAAAEHGLTLDFRQSNHEGELIDWIHEAGDAVKEGRAVGVVFNAGAYTHTSLALADAISGSFCPTIEVHISNVHAREELRHHSYLSPVAKGIIVGLGVAGYELGIRALAQ